MTEESDVTKDVLACKVTQSICESLAAHGNLPAYDFQLADRLNNDRLQTHLDYLVGAGILERATTYKLTRVGLEAVTALKPFQIK